MVDCYPPSEVAPFEIPRRLGLALLGIGALGDWRSWGLALLGIGALGDWRSWGLALFRTCVLDPSQRHALRIGSLREMSLRAHGIRACRLRQNQRLRLPRTAP